MSDLTLRDIVDRAHKSGQPVAEGLIHFLDEKLLGSDEPVNVSEVRGINLYNRQMKDIVFKHNLVSAKLWCLVE